MKITKVEICNFRAIDKLTIECSKNLNVFAGINGSGKSTILDALSIMLSWVVNRIPNESVNGMHWSDMDIRNGTSKSYIDIHIKTIIDFNQIDSYRWYKCLFRRGTTKDFNSSYNGASKLAQKIRENAHQDGLPLVAYYHSKRNVIDIPLRIRKKHEFDQFECYDEALKGASNFRHFFEWFRNREDLENENRKYADSIFEPDDIEFPDRQLEAVRKSLKEFLPHFSDFSVRRNPLRMVAYKNKKEYRIEQLSDGEKNLIAMVGDIARRLAIGNPQTNKPLAASGIVLIDEIELHLHPSWQRDVIKKLTKTFPNCQFFITTHSPQVLGEVKPENIRLLDINKDGTIECYIPDQSYGLESNEILNELMQPNGKETLSRNTEVEKELKHIFTLIDEENFDQAKIEINRLKEELHGSIPDLIHAESLITMLRPSSKSKRK